MERLGGSCLIQKIAEGRTGASAPARPSAIPIPLYRGRATPASDRVAVAPPPAQQAGDRAEELRRLRRRSWSDPLKSPPLKLCLVDMPNHPPCDGYSPRNSFCRTLRVANGSSSRFLNKCPCHNTIPMTMMLFIAITQSSLRVAHKTFHLRCSDTHFSRTNWRT